jgi:hypothetical protein
MSFLASSVLLSSFLIILHSFLNMKFLLEVQSGLVAHN